MWWVNGVHFPAHAWYHKVLYTGLSFTHSCTNGWLLPCKALSSPTGSNQGFSVLPMKYTLTCRQLEPGFEQPTLQSLVHSVNSVKPLPTEPKLMGEGRSSFRHNVVAALLVSKGCLTYGRGWPAGFPLLQQEALCVLWLHGNCCD